MAQKLGKEIESKAQQALFHLLLDLLQNKSLWYTVAWQILFVNSFNATYDNEGWEDLNFKNVMLGHFAYYLQAITLSLCYGLVILDQE